MTKAPTHKSVRLLISGRVQGVGFRNWTLKRATRSGVHGWVRNLTSGEVEAVFSGSSDAVNRMIEACWKGPITAKVQHIEVSPWLEPLDASFVRLPNL